MIMVKKGFFIIVLTFLFVAILPSLIFAQSQSAIVQYSDNDYINSVYLEFGGAGTYVTINYDLIINKSSVVRFGAAPNVFQPSMNSNRAIEYNTDDLTIVGIISYSKLIKFSSTPHSLETGLGIALGDIETQYIPGAPSLFANFGYRFLTNKEKGSVIRLSFTPFIKNNVIHPWFGVSLGYSFKPNFFQ
ncbi:MAG: hypothetical protein RIE52_05055 [Balneola sp.]|jgi:hypothetical protein